MKTDAVWEQFKALSPDARQAVSDFIALLHDHVIRPPAKSRRKISLRDEPAFGIWKERRDIKDSAAYVRELRRKHWRG